MNPIKSISRLKQKFLLFTQKKKIEANFLIFDDIFPNPLSDWRHNEFLYYLQEINNTKIISNINNTSSENNGNYRRQILSQHPQHANRIIKFNQYNSYSAKLGYCLFFNNLKRAFPIFEKNKIPYVFTLYPGGGFKIYDKQTEFNLETYFNSPLFRHVIVNMPHVYEYIKRRFGLDDGKLTYIYGAPLVLPINGNSRIQKVNKIRIAFSSHKYIQHGIDKGFDIFNKVAKSFQEDDRFEFVCIGGFDEGDLIEKTDNIQFKSNISPNDLHFEFENYDIIMSPNRSHVLNFGAFDGFPTGSVIHAANSGCMMMISDEMNNAKSLGLINNLDYILIAPNIELIREKLLELSKNVDSINRIAKNGREKLLRNLKQEEQMIKRMNIISRYL